MKPGFKTFVVLMLAGLFAGGVLRVQQSSIQGAPAPQESLRPAQGSSVPGAVRGSATDKPVTSEPFDLGIPAPSKDDSDACEVPAYLLATESLLQKVAEAIKSRQQLDILVVGSGSSALGGPEGASMSYPARLEAALRERLKGVAVSVTTDLQVKKTAADVAATFKKLAKERKPALVVWQTGTVDALRSIDAEDFRAAIDEGISTLRKVGIDVLLMNLQYSPHMEAMILIAPYLDNMRIGAQEHDVPLFDRFAMMRYWNESGQFDFFNLSHGFGLAKRVHDCLGQALATFVINAAHINTAELRTQRR